MSSRTVSAGRSPRITLEKVAGDLSLVGWEGEEVLIKADDDGLQVSQDGERVVVSSEGDLSARVPRLASVLIRSVLGDMAMRGLDGDVQIGDVGGDASVRDVNNASIGSIESDFSFRNARGNLSVQSIGGDASIREVQGNVSLHSVADDLVLRDVRGNVNARAGEDVVLYIDPQPGNSYAVDAGDDILLILPPNADVKLVLNADEIHVDWPDIPAEEEVNSRTLILGSGAANVSLNAGGDLHVSSQERARTAPEEFGNFAGMMFDWSEFGNQLGAHITRRVEQVTRRAAEQAERAARRAEAKLRGRGARGRVNVGRWNWNMEPGSGAPAAAGEAVSEQERLVILKMLAEKKITADEADKLLAALEGGQ